PPDATAGRDAAGGMHGDPEMEMAHRAWGAVMERRAWGGAVLTRWPVVVLDASPARWCWVTLPGASRIHPVAHTVERVGDAELSVCAGETWVATAVVPSYGRLGLLRLESALPVEDRGRGRLSFVHFDVELAAATGRLWHEPLDGVVTRLGRDGVPGPVIDRAQRGLRDLDLRLAERSWPFDGWLEVQAERLARRLAA
ncbi:MAG: hypothetical protein AB1416_12860, partial [Actinomycetota bacterium]